MGPRWRLVAAAVAFLLWVAFLGYAALSKSRDPIVSRAQVAVAPVAVVAEVGESGRATVLEALWGEGPQGELDIPNLAEARGYTRPGRYLLFLTLNRGTWVLVGRQRSPGAPLAGVGPPVVYPWTDDVRKQVERLRGDRPAPNQLVNADV